MKITALKPAVKTVGRWNVFVDGAYSFSLNESQVLEHRLKVGQEVDEETLERLKDDSDFGKAYARALDLILRRPRSRKEMHDYARRKAWSDNTTARVIARLEEKGYIDDRAFAEAWVRSRESMKPSSRRKLVLELRQKGIDPETIEVIFSNDAHDEKAMLRRIIEKKRSRYDDQKLIAYLARQGFSYDTITSVLNEDT